jgi:ferredoxin
MSEHGDPAGDSIYVINPELCQECEGAFESPQCITVCPVEGCIVPDPTHPKAG